MLEHEPGRVCCAGAAPTPGAADAARLVLEHPDMRLVPPVRGPRDVRVLLRRRVFNLEPRDAAGAGRGVPGMLRRLRAGVRGAGGAAMNTRMHTKGVRYLFFPSS